MVRNFRDPINGVGADRFRQIQQAWNEGVAEESAVLFVSVGQGEGIPRIVVGGVAQMVRATENIRVPGKLIAKLRATGEFTEPFLEFLRPLRFTLDIFSVSEGEVVLSGTPLVQICGRRVDCLLFGDFARSSVEEGTLAVSLACVCRERAGGLPLFLAPSSEASEEALIHSAKGCRIAGWAGTTSKEVSEYSGLRLMKDYQTLRGSKTLSIPAPESAAALGARIGEGSPEGMGLYLKVRHLESLDAVASLADTIKDKVAGILLDPLDMEDGGSMEWRQGIARVPGTLRVVRSLNEQGDADGDFVFSEGEDLPVGARPLLERYTDRGRTCRPIPEPARSEVLLARAREELGGIESDGSGYSLQWSADAEGLLGGIKA